MSSSQANSERMLSHIEESVSSASQDFHSFFRNRGLILRPLFHNGNLDLRTVTQFESEIQIDNAYSAFVRKNLVKLKRCFLPILLSEKTARILWSLHCIPSETAVSLLTEIVPGLERIAQVVRGGANVYKLNGWVVHVLIGYSILTEYIPIGELPSTIDWDSDVRAFAKNILRNKYHSLDRSVRAVLHVAMLLHDIGVSIAVEDHDRHGIALVKNCIREINITNKQLMDNGININLSEFIWQVSILIGLHTFINRLGVEYSRKRSKQEMDKVISQGLESQSRRRFIMNDLPSLLLLIGVADLIAVDDELLDGRKVQEVTRGYDALISILCEPLLPVNQVEEGYKRFVSFMGRKDTGFNRAALEKTIERFGLAPDIFWVKFYNIEEFNFALSLVQFLPGADDILLSFLLIFSFIDQRCGKDMMTYELTRVVFDHNLRPEHLLVAVEAVKYLDVSEYLFYVSSEGWTTVGLRFELIKSDTQMGNHVFISREKTI